MTSAPASPKLRGDDGAALLEFALVLPLLATVVFGAVDLGRAFVLKARLTQVAREGAFHAQFHPYDILPNPSLGCSSSITTVAHNGDPSLTTATVTVLNPATGAVVADRCGEAAPSGTRRLVRVTAPMSVFTPFVGALVGDTIAVRGEAEVVVQG